MFEKEADYRKARKESKDRITKVIKVWSAEEETIHDEGFQKGAEFGYKLAHEEMDYLNKHWGNGKDKANEAKEIIQKLIANAPNTYSGTDIELQQKKMFSFQDAVNKAEQFLKE